MIGYSTVFMVSSVILFGIVFSFLLNILYGGFIDWRGILLLFVGLLFVFGISFVTYIVSFDNVLIVVLFGFVKLAFLLGLVLFVASLLLLFKELGNNVVKARFSIDDKKGFVK